MLAQNTIEPQPNTMKDIYHTMVDDRVVRKSARDLLYEVRILNDLGISAVFRWKFESVVIPSFFLVTLSSWVKGKNLVTLLILHLA